MSIEVDYVIFSLDAYNKHKIDSLLGYVIESPLPNIAAVNIPGPFTFIVSIMLRGLEETEECELRFLIGDGEEYIYDTEAIAIAPEEEISIKYVPKEFKTRFINFRLRDVYFKSEGGHTYTVLINGNKKKIGRFGVFQIPKGDTDGK